MFRTNLSKVSRVAIILLIAVFVIAGITACKKKITQPDNYQQSTEITNPGETGPVTPDDTNADPEEPKGDNTNMPSWDDWNYGPNPPGGSSKDDNTNIPSWDNWNYGPNPPSRKK